MTAKAKKKGTRVGPFQIGKRCKHAATEVGYIHEAHNVQTGAPTMVMMPGPRSTWRPKKNWQVRVSFQTTPPFIALEVEEAPASGRLSDLANLLVLLLAGLDATKDDASMRAHLTREPLGRWMRRPPLKALAVAGVTVLALAGGFWWGSGTRPEASPAPLASAPATGAPVDAGHPSSFLVDGAVQAPTGISYPLPDKPFSNQARPPCRTKRDEIAINNGCWVEIARKPPCHEEQAEYQGKCYLPVSERGPRPAQSVSP